MMELPESHVIAGQLRRHAVGKTILNVTAAHTPHRLAWYFGDPNGYHQLLAGRRVKAARALGGNVELCADGVQLLFQDGASPRFLAQGEPDPQKHQLLLEFDDFSRLSVTIAMYGGICAFREGQNDSPYYLACREGEPRSPLGQAFDEAYFSSLLAGVNRKKLTAKAFLTTEQRIPGLGNGVMQDILWNARIHPRRKMDTLCDADLERLFHSVKSTLAEMAIQGGRDVERDLFGDMGGYHTILSRKTIHQPCPACGGMLHKEAFGGGTIYYCAACQPLPGKE